MLCVNYAGKFIVKATEDSYHTEDGAIGDPVRDLFYEQNDAIKPHSGWIKAETMPQDKGDKSPEDGGTSVHTALKTGPSAPVHSSTTTSSADTSEDDLQHDADIARSSGGGTTTSTSPAEVEEAHATSRNTRKKRKHDQGDRFSFTEPFLYKVSSKDIGKWL